MFWVDMGGMMDGILRILKNKIMQRLVFWILALVVIWIFFRRFERMNVWRPTREYADFPTQVEFAFKEVFIETADGIRICAWYVPCEEAKASLLFCHGNAGNISYRVESLRLFHSLGLNVLIFDYRGYGKSEGWLSEEGTYQDGEAAYRWLRNKVGDSPIVLFGRSLGTAVAVELTRRVEADGLIFESGFTSVPDIAGDLFPFLPLRYFCSIQYDSLSKIGTINTPVMVIHSREDTIIPYRHGERIFKAAVEPKTFLTIQGDHNDGFLLSEVEYIQGIKGFFEQRILLDSGKK